MAFPTTIRLDDPTHLEAGCAWLAERHPRFAYALDVTGPISARVRPDGFDALLRSIVSQQVSTAAAAAVLSRMESAGLTHVDAILAASDETLRAAGVSRQKARYLRGIAAADLNYVALRSAPAEVVTETLMALPGIGRWTAEIYLMFAQARPDVLAAGDLGLQHGARLLFDLLERPDERQLRTLAEAWSPWRTVAALILWRYYDHQRSTAR